MASVDIGDSDSQIVFDITTDEAIGLPEEGLDIPFLVRQLLDVVPNPLT